MNLSLHRLVLFRLSSRFGWRCLPCSLRPSADAERRAVHGISLDRLVAPWPARLLRALLLLGSGSRGRLKEGVVGRVSFGLWQSW